MQGFDIISEFDVISDCDICKRKNRLCKEVFLTKKETWCDECSEKIDKELSAYKESLTQEILKKYY